MGCRSVGVTGNDGFQVEKQILCFGTRCIGGEHCQRCFHFSVEYSFRGIAAHSGLVVVELGEAGHLVVEKRVATVVNPWLEKPCNTASPVLSQPPAILERVAAGYGIFQPCNSALIGRFAMAHQFLVVQHTASKVVFCTEWRGDGVEVVPMTGEGAEWIAVHYAHLVDVGSGKVIQRHSGEIVGSKGIAFLAQRKGADNFINVGSIGACIELQVSVER